MKLSVWSSYYYELTPEDAVLEYEKHGYHYCELSDEHAQVLMERGDCTEIGKQFKAFADAHGVSFSQGHMILNIKLCEDGSVDILKRQLDLFKAIGVKAAVLHCDSLLRFPDMPLEEKLAKNKEALRTLLEYIADTDMVICLENLRHPSIVKTAESLLYFIDELKSPNLGICLDTGHLNTTENKSQMEFIQKAGKHIKALHIADNEGVTDQHMMPFGRGTVDIIEVIREMKKIGYDGLYNLEIPGEKKGPYPIRGYKLDYIKRVFEYLDNEI